MWHNRKWLYEKKALIRYEEYDMESLILGIRVILPIIVFMGLGYLFRTIRVAGEKTFREMNKVCFRCFLPVMIFYNIYRSNLHEDFELSVLIFAIISVLCVFFAAILFTNKAFRGSKNRSVVIQGIYRSNYVLFGMEVTRTICGEENMGMASILAAVIVPIFNVLAVVLFETYGSETKNKLHVLKGIVTNPLIIASVLGIVVKLLDVSLPGLAETIVGNISRIATPLALICLGGTFAFKKVAEYKKELLVSCLGRLVVVPLIFLSIAVFLGIRGSNLVALMVMLASPAAISSYTMACEMKGNGELAGMIVVFTSVFSIISIFLWVFTLHMMHLF